MYGTDLSRITLDEYAVILRHQDLLPSRRILLEGLDGVLEGLAGRGVSDLAGLSSFLKDKKAYAGLADHLGTTAEYLNVLRRDIAGYVPKPMPLVRTGLLAAEERDALAAAGVRTTADVYDRARRPAGRDRLSEETGLPRSRIDAIAGYADLLRVNGIGSAFVLFLSGIGIRNVSDLLTTPVAEIMKRYRSALADGEGPGGPELRDADVEYCLRFARLLDNDIEWA